MMFFLRSDKGTQTERDKSQKVRHGSVAEHLGTALHWETSEALAVCGVFYEKACCCLSARPPGIAVICTAHAPFLVSTWAHIGVILWLLEVTSQVPY